MEIELNRGRLLFSKMIIDGYVKQDVDLPDTARTVYSDLSARLGTQWETSIQGAPCFFDFTAQEWTLMRRALKEWEERAVMPGFVAPCDLLEEILDDYALPIYVEESLIDPSLAAFSQ